MNIQQIRLQLPSVTNQIFLNSGTCGPLPVSVIDRMKASLDHQLQHGRITLSHFEELIKTKDENRSLIAEMINSSEDEISLTGSTSDGLNIVINGFDWKKGDEIITTNAEHPTGWSPAYNLQRLGVKVKTLDVLSGFENILEQLQKLITAKTRLISISHVIYCSGDLLPAKEIIALAHNQNIPVLLDGAQVFGTLELDIKALGCDYYAAPGQKWIGGPENTGFLYVSKNALYPIHSTFTGYFSIKNLDLEKGMELQEDGQRFEFGTVQPANIAGMNEALKWIKSIGIHAIYKRNLALAQRLYDRLSQAKNIEMVNHHCQSSLVSFRIRNRTAEEVANTLQQKKIIVRPVPITHAVRISTGFYNTEEEIDKVYDLVHQM
jgi:L-cysteine/cystine lyase